jgi:hypothetical protein
MPILNLLDDAISLPYLDRCEARSDRNFTGLAYIEGIEKSQVTLVIKDGAMVGNIRVSDSYFQVRYVGADMHVVRQVGESRFP